MKKLGSSLPKSLAVLLVFILSFLAQAYAGVCPEKIYIDKPDCRTLCESVYQKIKKDVANFDSEYGLVSAYQQTSTLPDVSAMCACTFGKKNVITDEYSILDVCYYTVRTSVPGVAVKRGEGSLDLSMPLSDYLLRLFLFDKDVADKPLPPIIALSPSGEMIKGMYTLYVSSIKGVSVYVAALLLTVALMWQFISMISGNFTQVVRSPGQFFSQLVTGEKISNYASVTLATLFLVLPLNGSITGLEMKRDAVLKEAKAKCELIKEEMEKEYDECVDEKQDLVALYGCMESGSGGSNISVLDVLTTIATDPSALVDMGIGYLIDVLSGDTSDYQKVIAALMGSIKAPWTCEAIAEKECKDMRDDLQKKYDQCINEYEKYKKEIPVELQQVEAPLAVRMIRDSVLWGSKFAEHNVLPVAAGVIRNYVINRYVNMSALSELSNAAGVDSVKAYKEAIDKMWNMPVYRVYGSEPVICQGVIDGKDVTVQTCADYYALTDDQRLLLVQQHPYECKDALITLGLFCKKLQKQKEIAADVEEEVKATKDRKAWLNDALTKTEDDFGWLSPAIMPLYSIYYELTNFHVKVRDDMAYGTLIAERHYRSAEVSYPAQFISDHLSSLYGTARAVGSFVGGVFNLAKNAVVGIGSAVVNKAEDIIVNEDVGDDFAGEISPSLSYQIGRTMVLYSIPPGDKFAYVLNKIGGFVEKIVIGLGAYNTIYAAAGVLIHFVKPILSIYLAAKINEIFLSMLPLIVGSFALLVRAIQYFLEVILLVLITPFYAIAAVTKQKNKVMDFFISMFKLTFFPVVFLIVAVMTFTAVELGYLFTYSVPVKYVLGLIPTDGIFTGFMAGVLDAVFVIFSALVCASLAWFVGFNMTETIIDWVSSIISYTDRKVQGFESIAKQHVGKLVAKTAI